VFKVVGGAEVKPLNEREFVPAHIGMMLESGDWIRTGNGSYVAVLFLDKSMLKIRENTEMEIKSQRIGSDQQSTDLFLTRGELWTKVKEQKGEFTISTPTSVASVKGTEFDLEHDHLANVTSLYVIEGVVEFTNELGKILVREMTYSKSEQQKAPEPAQKMPKEMVPTWQKQVEPKWGFNLIPERKGPQPVLEPLKVNISALDAKSTRSDISFNGVITVESDGEFIELSSEGSRWANSITLPIKDGRATIQVRSKAPVKGTIVVSSQNADSRKLDLEFFRSRNQRKALGTKLDKIVRKENLADLREKIGSAEVQSAQVVGGGSVEDIMQKVEIGEFEVTNVETIENPDGTITVRMTVQQRSITGAE